MIQAILLILTSACDEIVHKEKNPAFPEEGPFMEVDTYRLVELLILLRRAFNVPLHAGVRRCTTGLLITLKHACYF